MNGWDRKQSDKCCDYVLDDTASLTHSERKSEEKPLQCLSANQTVFLRCETAGVTTRVQCRCVLAPETIRKGNNGVHIVLLSKDMA